MPSGVPPPIVVSIESVAKPWWCSRTLWFNAVCLATAAVEANLGLIQQRLPGGLYAWLAFAMPIGNAVLRTFTAAAIAGMQRPLADAPTQVPLDPPNGGT